MRLKRAHHESSAPDVKAKKSQFPFTAFENFSLPRCCPAFKSFRFKFMKPKPQQLYYNIKLGARAETQNIRRAKEGWRTITWSSGRSESLFPQIKEVAILKQEKCPQILTNGILKSARGRRATADGSCSGEDLQERPFESAKSWKCFDQDSPAPEMWSTRNKYEGPGEHYTADRVYRVQTKSTVTERPSTSRFFSIICSWALRRCFIINMAEFQPNNFPRI